MKLTALSPRFRGVPETRTFIPDENLCHVPLSAKAAARSAENIATWREYLQADCIRTMIRMGWDYTT